MKLSLAQLSSPAAVQAALDEYATVGQSAFLERHGFGRASGYLVLNPRTDTWADSKAIAGVALAYQYPDRGGLKAAEFSGGSATVQRRLRSLGFEVRSLGEVGGADWQAHEVALIVADYLAMLTCELAGQAYSKTAHRKRLLQRLPGRTESSIEFKHANISAVMLELGFPYIKGYQPRINFQRHALISEVAAQVSRHPVLDEAALSAVQRPALTPAVHDFSRVRTEAPRRTVEAKEPTPGHARAPVQRDYLARESQNRSLGNAGEAFALHFERWRLMQLGAPALAERVEHVSLTRGDGLGYDIQSFEASGEPRYIEVKTTSFGERTPFFVSANELSFSREKEQQFRLYRLFDFREAPRLFELNGPIDRHCTLDPTTYRAAFG